MHYSASRVVSLPLLSSIAAVNSSVALDRKKRSKIHSVSLIYDPKVAATQDFESIYAVAYESLLDLETLDKRFSKFKLSLFAESSISIDRNVQTAEALSNLNNGIDLFLNILFSSNQFPNNKDTLNCLEWLIRRFNINIHKSNVESLLINILPYYQNPIFPRIVSLAHVSNLPPLFNWLAPFKKQSAQKMSLVAILKAFQDFDFLKLYISYLTAKIKKNLQYKQELIFFIKIVLSLLSINSKNQDYLTQITPIILQFSSLLLNSSNLDNQITAHTILPVLSATSPLASEVIDAVVETILSSTYKFPIKTSIVSIVKIYQSINIDLLEPFPLKNLKLLIKFFKSNEEYIDLIFNQCENSSNKFFSSYLRSIIINQNSVITSNNHHINKIINQILHFSNFTKSEKRLILIDAVKIADANKTIENSNLITIFENFINIDKELVNSILTENNLDFSKLEISLQTTLIHKTNKKGTATTGLVSEMMEVEEEETEDNKSETQKFISTLQSNKTDTSSFLYTDKTTINEFSKLLPLFSDSISLKLTQKFFTVVFEQKSSLITFLTRVSVSQGCMLKIRLLSLKNLKNELSKLNDVSLILFLPITLALLLDPIQFVRSIAGDLLKIINNSDLGKEPYLLNQLYDSSNSTDVNLLNKEDSKNLLEKLIQNLSGFIIDNHQLFGYFSSQLFNTRKFGKLYLAFFANQILLIKLPYIKIQLLLLFLNFHNNLKISKSLRIGQSSEIFKEILNNYPSLRDFWKNFCDSSKFDFKIFEKAIVDIIGFKEKASTGINFIKSSLLSNHEQLSNYVSNKVVLIWNSLKFDVQLNLFNTILDHYADTENNDVSYDPLLTLQSLDIQNVDFFTNVFKDLQIFKKTATLDNARESFSINGSSAFIAKRRRRSSNLTKQVMKRTSVTKVAELYLKKLTAILEIYERKAKLYIPTSDLLTILFNLLSDLDTLGSDGNLPVLYAQETLANCILLTVGNIKDNSISLQTNPVRADLIVSSIRSSQSPQFQNKLLLVIASLARINPELILHSVMPIFTFMGSHTIRQDDEFSNNVIEKTILYVVPALASNAQNGKVEEIEFLLTSFVSAFNHIPRHRRVKLFSALANTLCPKHSIHIILFLVGCQFSDSLIEHKMGECRSLVEFSSSFLKRFTPNDQLTSIKYYLELWNELNLIKEINRNREENNISEIDESSLKIFGRSIFGPSFVYKKVLDISLLQNNLIKYIDGSLFNSLDYAANSHTSFIKLGVAKLFLTSKPSDEIFKTLLTSFKNLIQDIMLAVNHSSFDSINEKENNPLLDLLNNILSLLPLPMFVDAIIELIQPLSKELSDNKLLSISSQVIRLTATQFDLESIGSESNINCANLFIEKLINVLDIQTNIELKQSSLDTFSSLVKRFGTKINEKFLIRGLNFITGSSLIDYISSPEIIISSNNLISNIITVVGVKSVSFLPKILKSSFEIFDSSKSKINKNKQDFEEPEDSMTDLLQTSIILLYSGIIQKMPIFMQTNISNVFMIIFNSNNINESTRLLVLNSIIENMEKHVVLKSLCSLWPEVSKSEVFISVGLFLNIIGKVVNDLDRKTANLNASMFFKFLLLVLEYRVTSKFDINTIYRIESLCFDCGNSYALKTDERIFRPLFSSITRWAFNGEAVTNKQIKEDQRITSFFRFFNKFQENLKSVVTAYYSYIFESVIKLLERFKNGDINDVSLKRLVFMSLLISFKYDLVEKEQSGYWQAESRFDSVSKGLTDQLSNIDDGIGKHLVKSIVTLSYKCNSDEHNKKMCVLLISHMKYGCKSKEKLWAAKVLKELYQKVGSEWENLLPQLVPTIAELLEDDDEEVEMEVRSGLVKVIEKVLGEPLSKYLD
ncbi:snoRNA-binding rRNA-processing protein UTP10 ASCRUDRAFT_79120 [Ascoidea rubescens DSM 1968]|uniref:U3 small nucleolar RNA-associated protein 10 n=1 Tax=Ascoidea rubescens DSM 1968 TaxID=1344418 RepID=A0A1D2VRL7_9ASCO|nr:hypothetical protein ASCRUDRAFT_79120 [Ascoidea rubescens DSM 1968]ODV64228.1 hypothetical protein ASCRUDRAFT_79120 [Ascoidea rubescens DSM 1968]